MAEKKAYTEAFREETLALAQSSGKSKAALERELGLYPGQIRQWQKREKGNGGMNGNVQDAKMEKTTETELKAEVKRLTKENARLREEREILKRRLPSSRRGQSEIRLHPSPTGAPWGGGIVRGDEGGAKWLLCVVQATGQPTGGGKRGSAGGDSGDSPRKSGNVWLSTGAGRTAGTRSGV